MSSGGVAFVVILVSLGGALLLYLLVQREHENRQVMDRDAAQEAARKDRHERERERNEQ